MTTNKRMVELDVVLKILEESKVNQVDGWGRTTLSISPTCIERLKSIHSIPNPIEIAEEMIGKNQFGNGIDYSEDYCNALQELLSKLKS